MRKHPTSPSVSTMTLFRKLFAYGLLLVLCLPTVGCQEWLPQQGGAETKMYSKYKRGLALFQAKKYNQALGLFLELQSQYPNQLELMYNLGTVYYHLGKPLKKKNPKRKEYLDKAEKNLRQVLDNGSAYLRQKANYNLGLVHTELNQYEQALMHFSSASNIARKTLKKADGNAEYNRDQISMLIRQRERKRQNLNRTRVFRYAPKVIELTASKEYDDPIRQIALRGVFTHQATNKSYTVWGFPVSKQRWKIQFVPTRTGKWKYSIQTVTQALPGMKKKTLIDKRLQDKGLFKVLPSARAGRLVVSGGNAVRFAWKKPKETAKNKVKAKKKPGQAKKPKKKSPIPEDETIVLWQGLSIPGLFNPKLSEKRFQEHQKMLELVTPSAVYVDLPLDELFQWEDGKPLKVKTKRMETLTKRLASMRKNPTYKWVLVYSLRTDEDLKPSQLQHAIQYLCGRLGHVDVLWSLHQWEGKTRDKVVGFLRSYDPYKQPIALAYDEAVAKRIDKLPKELLKRLTQPPKPRAPTKATKDKDGKKGKKKAKAPALFKPNPKYKHFVWHTTHNIATGKALQKLLLRPWIGDLPLPVELEPKSLRKQWWKLYIAGISTTVALDRALNDDEIQSVIKWQRQAYEAEKLPPHPDDVEEAKKKAKKGPASRPAARAKPKARVGKPSARKPANQAKSGKGKPAPQTKPKARKAVAKVTPKDERISRPYIHFLRVRHYWAKFLGSFRFSGFVRPSMVRTVVPDLTALKKWRDAQQKKHFTLPNVRLAPPGAKDKDGKSGKKRSQLKPPSRRLARDRFGKKKIKLKDEPSLKRPKVEWKQVLLRGFLASNGPTVLFVPPSTKFKKPPRINWRKSRWDLEFRWYNAANGEFLKKKVFRQVTSLALTAPKKEAHVAKVSVQDHKMNAPYTVVLPPKLLKQATSKPAKPSSRPTQKNVWHLDDWKLWVQAPKPRSQGRQRKAPPPAVQHVSFVRTSQGYAARFLPNRMGVWTFYITYKGKKLKGFWGNAGKIQVLPSGLPAPVQRSQKGMRMTAGGRPYFFFARSVPNLLSNAWTQEQFQNTIKSLPRKSPGTTVLVTTLPKLSWSAAVPTQATSRPKSKDNWNPRLAEELDQLEERIKAAHNAGYHIALVLSKQQWGNIFQTGTHRLEYILDRFSSAYPLMWLVDKSKAKTTQSFLPMLIRAWYLRGYPSVQKAMLKARGKKGKAKAMARPKRLPAVPPPMLGVHIGRASSEKQLKTAAKTYDWMWLNAKSLDKEIQDFKLLQLNRPIVLTWRPLMSATSPFAPSTKGKAKVNTKALQRWAGFLWRAQMIGFGHTGRPVQNPLAAPPKVKKGQTPPKPKVAAVQKVPTVLRAFFQTFNWAQLRPPSKSLSFKSFEAFSAETPVRVGKDKKGKTKLQMGRDGHHVVAWINPTIRQYLQIKRSPKVPLKKHRYLWVNPMSGEQPVTPQLLPPRPAKGQRDQLQVPFRPAVLYVFRRPPQKGRRNQQRRRKQKKQDRNASKRQQVRNQVRNLQENRNQKRKSRRRSLTGKRG
ncbi:MAG: DUF5060 domain-containing protein [Deltaproteobacteria bacterium]|nr:MAG: DUF5060 domain-containing protein [Deltaproteobacteria bacterium]